MNSSWFALVYLVASGLAFRGNSFSPRPKLSSIYARSSQPYVNVSEPKWSPITIDTYVHVIVHTRPMPEDQVTEKEILQQLDVLNNDFRPYNISFDLKRLQLAPHPFWPDRDIYATDANEMGRSLRLGNFSSLNIYIRRQLSPLFPLMAGVTEQITEWTQISERDMERDGVEITFFSLPGRPPVGRSTGLGKALTHEVGHWLGLQHTFANSDMCIDGDGIEDTPIHKSFSGNCTEPWDSCPNMPGLDPIYNYMNYVVEDCYKEFTPGQVAHMHSVFKKRLLTETTIHRERWEEERHLQTWKSPKIVERCIGTKEWCEQGKEGSVDVCLSRRESTPGTALIPSGSSKKWYNASTNEGCVGSQEWCAKNGYKYISEQYCLSVRTKEEDDW
ncbi:hypothetical protein BDV33DRAFT_199994 [Aspergillus novoparasiticus]|uniref:Peptidase M43 pregnancy-associated plasma-A domain-containing protein n=1 Tax=Aspergillus novoparasiticus TaxID=986946 RepID=A0A5N6F275_9EURO|nr:hypothetical protein BDV33DRAFT_199994 [Aspergillus novoparasiticus]